MKKLGIGTYRPENPVGILNYQAFVGQKEKEGPLGAYFDFTIMMNISDRIRMKKQRLSCKRRL